jgi:hypothetical protein
METVMKKLLFGMALGAAVLIVAPGRAIAAACEGDLFVAVTGDPELGDGSAGNPFRTITKAVERAREVRSVCADPITIHVGPGDYPGSFPVGSSTVETLPITIDIPDLELRGSTILDMDNRDLPRGTSSSATTLAITGNSDELTAMIFIASDSGQTNRVTVAGFVLDASGGTDPNTVGIAIDRVQDFIVRGNIVTGLPGPWGPGNLEVGISTRAASGLIEGNYVTNNLIGVGPTGGNAAFPANVTVKGNRAAGNTLAGLDLPGTGDTAYPFNPRPESTTREIFDTFVGVATGNDFSNNLGNVGLTGSHRDAAGIRLGHQTAQSLASASRVTATINDNTINGNAIGVVIDAQDVLRPRPYSGSMTATFANNLITNSVTTPALVTFTHFYAALDQQQLVVSECCVSFEYLQNSTHIITHTGELDGLWIDHPVRDPIDCRTLCNALQINGEGIPRGTRSIELGPPLMSACPPPLPQCAPQL